MRLATSDDNSQSEFKVIIITWSLERFKTSNHQKIPYIGILFSNYKNTIELNSILLIDCLDSGPAPTNKPGRPSRPEDAYPEEEPELGVDHEVEEDQYVCYEAGKFSDLYSCGVFHECVTDGKHLNHYRFQCAPGTTYCPDTKMCGWERDCPCNERKRVKNKNQLNLKNLKHN
jgi:hypothetical protein